MSLIVRASLLSIVLLSFGCGRQPAPPKYVILISVDTLRADRLGSYGHDRATDPSLKRFAEESVVFENAACQATQTLLSHKSLFAGKYPLRMVNETTRANLQALAKVPREEINEFLVGAFSHPGNLSLVGRLKEGGYGTAAFTGGGWMRERFEFGRPFDYYRSGGRFFETILPGAMNWIDRNREKPFFLFLHAFDVHAPYWTREPYNSLYCRDHTAHLDLAKVAGKWYFAGRKLSEADTKGISDHYDAGINSADAVLGGFLEHLRKEGIYDEALIVLMSDHGESLSERGAVGHGALELEQIRVPLIMKFPAARGVAPRRVRTPVELVDVMPTILEACGLEPGVDVDGKSALGAAQGDGGASRRYAMSQIGFRSLPDLISNPSLRSVWEPDKWLVVHDAAKDSLRVFDLRADPRALTDLANRKPEGITPLLRHLFEADAKLSAGRVKKPAKVEIDAETRRRLRALGYLK